MGVWEGAGTSSSTPGMVNRGWWPSGHSWCLLPGLSPGQGLGQLALTLRSSELSASQALCTRLLAPRGAW